MAIFFKLKIKFLIIVIKALSSWQSWLFQMRNDLVCKHPISQSYIYMYMCTFQA